MSEIKKSPALAGILSAMPGLGQVYVGYYVSGFVNILVVAGMIALLEGETAPNMQPFIGLLLAFFWMFNIIDAVRKANLYNQHQIGEKVQSPPTDSPLVGGIVLILAGILFTLRITLGWEMEFLNHTWPLGLLLGGLYLLWKYLRVRRSLRGPE